MTNEQIALSAAHAAWVGAAASSCASIIALGIAVFGARREESRMKQRSKEQESAFCFALIGALEMVKPIIQTTKDAPQSAFDRRKYISIVDHAQTIARAGLAISVFDMQLLRDAYQLRGATIISTDWRKTTKGRFLIRPFSTSCIRFSTS